MPGRARTPRDHWTPRPADLPRACDIRRHPKLAGLEDNAVFRRMRMARGRTEPASMLGLAGLITISGEAAFLSCGVVFLLEGMLPRWGGVFVSDPPLPLLLAAWARVASGFLVPRLESDVALRTLRLAVDRRTMGEPSALEGFNLASAVWGFVASTRRILLHRILILSRIALVLGVLYLNENPSISHWFAPPWIVIAAVSLAFDASRLADDARAAQLLERLATHPPRIERGGGGEVRMWLVRALGIGLSLALPPWLIMVPFAMGYAAPHAIPNLTGGLLPPVFIGTMVLLGFAASRLRAPMIRKRADANFALLSERLEVLLLEEEDARAVPPGPLELLLRRRRRARGSATLALLATIFFVGLESGIAGYHLLAASNAGSVEFIRMEDFGITVRGPLDSHQRFFLKEGPTFLALGGTGTEQTDEVMTILRDHRSATRIRALILNRVPPQVLDDLEMPSLERIEISAGGFPIDLSPLTLHPSLEDVVLNNLAPQTDLSVLVGLPRLDRLWAGGDTDPLVPVKLPGPRHLTLSGDGLVRDVALSGPSSLGGLMYANNQAVSLSVRSMDSLRAITVLNCSALRELTLEGLCSLTRIEIGGDLSSLTSVTIRDCPRLGSVLLGRSSSDLPALGSVVIDTPRLREIEIRTSSASIDLSQITMPDPLPERVFLDPSIRSFPDWFEAMEAAKEGPDGWRFRPSGSARK